MSYRKILEKSGVYFWIQNTSKRKCQKQLERRKKQRSYRKLEQKIRKLNCKKRQKKELLVYLRRLR